MHAPLEQPYRDPARAAAGHAPGTTPPRDDSIVEAQWCYHDLSSTTAGVMLVVLLVARLVLGFAYSALNPLGEAPDEADHYAYAAYIEREHRLPEGPAMTQGKHPPLYYLLAAGLASALGVDMEFSFLRSNPDVGVGADAAAPNFFVHTTLEGWPWRDGALAMHLGRLVSVLAGTILIAATYALGHAIWPAWRSGPLAAAAFVAFLPEALFVGGAMSNDILAAMWATLALWMGLRSRPDRSLKSCRVSSWLAALGAGLAMGLAALTKASTTGLWPVVGAAIVAQGLWGCPRSRTSDRGRLWSALGRAAAAGAMALLVIVPWLWRNWRLYGDPLGWPLVLATIDRRQGPLGPAELLWLARGWYVSFWGKFGGAGHVVLPAPFYLIWTALVIAAIAGWAVLALSSNDGLRRPVRNPLGRTFPAGWIVLLGAPVMAALAIISYSRVALGTDQGRLLFPAIAPIALLLVGGLAAWMPASWRRVWLPVGMALGMALVALLALEFGITRTFAPPPEPTQADVAQAAPVSRLFGDEIELTAQKWTTALPKQPSEGLVPTEGNGLLNNGDVSLILYWVARHPISDDLRTALRLRDADGQLLWEWKRSPGAGRFSTDRWPPGRQVADEYRMPGELLGRAERLEIGVQPFPDGGWLPISGSEQGEFLTLPLPTP
jgi:hypothetical protein